jgi:RNA polymerase sigma-70 factor (ECF subfamily)
VNNDDLRKKLTALRAGDKTALEEIYDCLKTPMYTIILRVTRDKSLSEDILQEVFVKLYLSPPISAKNPRAYLFQMARNLAVDGVRKLPRFAGLDDVENLVYLPDDPSERMDLEHAMQTLPLRDCQIVSLHVNGGLKFREIAVMLGIPLGTVIWQYHRAIQRLRSHLSGGAI